MQIVPAGMGAYDVSERVDGVDAVRVLHIDRIVQPKGRPSSIRERSQGLSGAQVLRTQRSVGEALSRAASSGHHGQAGKPVGSVDVDDAAVVGREREPPDGHAPGGELFSNPIGQVSAERLQLGSEPLRVHKRACRMGEAEPRKHLVVDSPSPSRLGVPHHELVPIVEQRDELGRGEGEPRVLQEAVDWQGGFVAVGIDEDGREELSSGGARWDGLALAEDPAAVGGDF